MDTIGWERKGHFSQERIVSNWQTVTVLVRGVTPTMMHNGQLADPLNKWSKAIKVLTAKGKKKTDADIAEIARLEWYGSLYVTDDGRPCWPGENIEGMLRDAAKKERRGKETLFAIRSRGEWPVEHDGPADLDSLWENERYRKVCQVRVQKSRVVRCRPIFPEWSLSFKVEYDSNVLTRDDLERWIMTAGEVIGLSEWRPKFGLFEVVKVS